MSQRDSFEHFAQALLPPGLPVAALTRLQASARPLCVARGDIADVDGTDQRRAVFVSSGAAKLVGHVGADREQIVAFAFGGDLLVLTPSSPTPYALHALTECRLLAFPANDLIRLALECDREGSAILERALLAIDRAREKSVILGRKTARERLASFLVSMAGRIGRPDGKSIILELPMSRREIADSLGLTIETVSRQLTELRNEGIVQTRGRSLLDITDMVRMSECAFAGA